MEKDDLVKHGGIMLFATGASFLFGYLFHSYMGRNLGPEEYGILDSLLSVFYIFLIPISTVQAVIAKFSSNYISTNRPDCIRLLMFEGFKRLLVLGFLIFILLSILSPVISDFLKMPSVFPVILLGIAVLLSLILPVSRGVLQGIQKFNHLGLNISLEKFIVLIAGIMLIGSGVNGAIFSIVISLFFVILISFLPLHFLKQKKSNRKLEKGVMVKYSVPVFLSLSAIVIMANIDMIVVKHYFDPVQAGGYASINIMGKVLFFLSFNIANVIYPKASLLFIQKKDSVFLLKKGLLYMGAISFSTVLMYTLFPEQIMNMVFGAQYLGFISLLAPYAFAMGILAFGVVIVHYNLSTMNFIRIRPLILSMSLEMMLLAFFHDSLVQVISGVLVGSLVLLILINIGSKNFDKI